jgi:carbamoyltransferase
MRVLGISAFHRDAAAALVVDGEVVAAAQEERFTRLTLDPAFPTRAIRWCLSASGIHGRDLDRVVFYEKPLRKFERVLARSLQGFPSSARAFSKSAFLWFGERLWIRNRIAEHLALPGERILFVQQARALLANAYYQSPFDRAALLLLDDVGEWSSTVLGRGEGDAVELLYEVRHPHSLGLLASALTQFLGFAPGEDEHKLEALAALGTPRRTAEVARLFRAVGPSFELATGPFRFDDGGERLFTDELERILGPARRSGDPLSLLPEDPRHADLAASVQLALEERALELARELHRRTGGENLCVAGLLAQNRGILGRLAAEGPFRNVFVPLCPGKAGGALGAAQLVNAVLGAVLGGTRRPAALASAFGEPIDERAEPGASELGDAARAREELARRLLGGELVGWVRGPMEFGVRSLGRRVALALPGAVPGTRLLEALRHVEAYLPCRLAVTREAAGTYFELPESLQALASLAHVMLPAREALRSAAPTALRSDGRAWPQVVARESDPELHALLESLGRSGAPPLLWITDLALRGSPLVRSESEAVEALGRSGLAALVAGTRLYLGK